MNGKEELVLSEIINYVKENKTMPTHRYLQKRLNYKSVNSITWYIRSLEKQNYLSRNSEGKIILNDNSKYCDTGLKKIKIINLTNQYIHLFLNKNKKYIAYKINNNFFCEKGIFKNDILIINTNKKLQDNDLGLFIIDNKYRVMEYSYKDGFYYLKDNEELLLHKIKILGKIIMIEKKL